MSSKWTAGDVPNQSGRVAVVTGANTGIGYEAAAVLAAKGARVVLAVRNVDKGQEAVRRIEQASPGADVSVQQLDLTSLDSIRAAAEELKNTYQRIDLLINNAGVMMTPRETTKDGFELQFGTNHLGHFALTGQVLENVVPVVGSRVVTISSQGHRGDRIRFDDLQWERGYNRTFAYAQSKLANLLFTYELARRLAAKGRTDNRGGGAPRECEYRADPRSARIDPAGGGIRVVAGDPEPPMGAEPTLRAATDPDVRNAQYYGPDGIGEQRGHPKLVESSAQSHNEEIQRRLWTVSEELTGHLSGLMAPCVPSRTTGASSPT